MPRIELRPQAREDLRRTLTDLGRRSPAAAEQLESRIDEVMDLVARYPRVGKRVHPEADAEYRSVVADSYLVWYQVRGTDEVIVLAVRHGKQRPPKLAELEERAEPQP